MRKIFYYELKRLLCSKSFVGVYAVTLFYGWQVLSGEVIGGIAHTAPFSPWSFGYYLAQVLPLICIGELILLARFTSGAEKRVAALTAAAPVDVGRYLLIRSGAVLVGAVFLGGGMILLGIGFYIRLFGPRGYGDLALPAALVLVPSILFCIGLGWLLGRAHPAGTYGAMALALALCAAPLPMTAGLSLRGFFAAQPLLLNDLDPAFSVPSTLLLARSAYLVIGVGMLAASLRKQARNQKR